MTTHYNRIISAIENLDHSQLCILLVHNKYQNMPTDTYLTLFKKAFKFFRAQGDISLNYEITACQGSVCQPTPQIIQFRSPSTNKKLPIALKVSGGQVMDMYQCYQTCAMANISLEEMLADYKSYYILDESTDASAWRKANPYKKWEELEPIFEFAIADIQKYSKDGVWKKEDFYRFLNDHQKIYSFCRFYDHDIDNEAYSRVLNIYEILRRLYFLDQVYLELQCATLLGKGLKTLEEKESWLQKQAFLYFNLPLEFNEKELCLELHGLTEIKLPIEEHSYFWEFQTKYKQINEEVARLKSEEMSSDLPF